MASEQTEQTEQTIGLWDRRPLVRGWVRLWAACSGRRVEDPRSGGEIWIGGWQRPQLWQGRNRALLLEQGLTPTYLVVDGGEPAFERNAPTYEHIDFTSTWTWKLGQRLAPAAVDRARSVLESPADPERARHWLGSLGLSTWDAESLDLQDLEPEASSELQDDLQESNTPSIESAAVLFQTLLGLRSAKRRLALCRAKLRSGPADQGLAILQAAMAFSPKDAQAIFLKALDSPHEKIRIRALYRTHLFFPWRRLTRSLAQGLSGPESVRTHSLRLWIRTMGTKGLDSAVQALDSEERIRERLSQAAVLGALDWGQGGLGMLRVLLELNTLSGPGRKKAETLLLKHNIVLAHDTIENQPAVEPGPEPTGELSRPNVSLKPPAPTPEETEPDEGEIPAEPPTLNPERAKMALAAALSSGIHRFSRLQTLVESSVVPDATRIEALRELAKVSRNNDIDSWLESMLQMELPEALLSLCLEIALQKESFPNEVIFQLALDPSFPAQLRNKAYRCGQQRGGRDFLDRCLLRAPLDIAERALLDLFTSLRYLPPQRREEVLANLFTEHRDTEVKASAARALGRFGVLAETLQILQRSLHPFTPTTTRAGVEDGLRTWLSRSG